MDVRRLGIAALTLGLLSGSVAGVVAQEAEDATSFEDWRTKEVEAGVLRILDDDAGHDLTRKWPRNHRGLNHIAVGPDGDVWLSVSVPTTDRNRDSSTRLWPLGREKTYGRAHGIGRHHRTMAFDDVGRLWIFGNRIVTLDDGEWSSTRSRSNAVSQDGSVWLGGGMGVEQWDGTELIPHLDGVWTGGVFRGPDDTIGVESWDGTRLFDGTDWLLISHRDPARAVSPDGALGVRTDDGRGVRLFWEGEATTVLDGTRVNSISAAPDGSLWVAGSVGRNRAGVYRIDPAQVFAALAASANDVEEVASEDATST